MKTIEIGVGIEEIKFGMLKADVEKVLGKPDEIDKELYGENEEAMLESWHYDELDLSLGFDEDEDWKLITVAVSDSKYTLKDKALVGLKISEIIDVLNAMGYDEIELEEDEEISVLYLDDQSMKIWLENQVVTEVQWGPLFQDEDTIAWPK
ncbi:MAG: hypothetical protein ACPGSD_01240 [Flavobacteriales bacterium]